MFVSKKFRLTSELWCVPLWSSYVKRWAMTAPSMWQISSCVSFVSRKILCNAWFQTQATNEFYRNVINNNKITPNKQASIIGSKEWHDEKWSSVLHVYNICLPLTYVLVHVVNLLCPYVNRHPWHTSFIHIPIPSIYIHNHFTYMVCLLLVALFTYPGCLWSGSSGSPSGSDSPGYLLPDHPHPRSATLLSPRIISQIIYRDSSTQARILVTAPLVAGTSSPHR